MEAFIPAVLAITVVGAFYLAQFLLAKRTLKVERGLIPRLQEFCWGSVVVGGRTGLLFRLAVYENFLVLSYFVRTTAVPFSQITGANIKKDLLGRPRLLLESARGGTYWLQVKDPSHVLSLVHHA